MAKRSVKRERQRAQQGPAQRSNGRPPPAAAPARNRGFWLGVLVAAALLVPLGVVAVIVASGGDDPAPAAAPDPVESEAERLRRETQVRDREQVQELTERMRQTVDDLGPVVSGFADTFPPGEDNRTGPLASAAAVQEWRGLVRDADAYFEDPPSGETGTNVARGELLERARAQRDLAIRSWSVAATQLDAINIATGFGHQHVYLGGAEEAGGFGADPAPEGSGAEGG